MNVVGYGALFSLLPQINFTGQNSRDKQIKKSCGIRHIETRYRWSDQKTKWCNRALFRDL